MKTIALALLLAFAAEAAPRSTTATAAAIERYRGRSRVRGGVDTAVAGSSCTPATGAAFVDGSWTSAGNVAFATRTAAAGISPGCANDLVRLEFPATTSGQYTLVRNDTLASTAWATISCGVWVQGTAGTGTIDYGYLTGGWTTFPCAFTTTASFCKFQNQAYGVSGVTIAFGNLTLVNGGTDRSANDIKAWGFRCVSGATITQ